MKKLLTIILVSSLLLHSAFSIAQNKSTTDSMLSQQQISLVNINRANEKQLLSLKGIGEAKASAIIDYRNSNGAFKSIDGLLNVKGIGQKVLTDNASRISI